MKAWVLLATGSTINVFCNPDMVKNLAKAEKALTINTNAVEFTAEYTAELPWSDMKIWFDPYAITNLGLLQEKYHAHYTNSKEDTFLCGDSNGNNSISSVDKVPICIPSKCSRDQYANYSKGAKAFLYVMSD
jgi:hypothetical protein